jgi:hypothetical protein
MFLSEFQQLMSWQLQVAQVVVIHGITLELVAAQVVKS